MNYKVISCTDARYVGWNISIPRLRRGLLKVTREDGISATFPVDKFIQNSNMVTLANSNFVAQLEVI